MHGRELTLKQKQHWESQLEIAERQVEYALRMLGRLPVEEEIQTEEIQENE